MQTRTLGPCSSQGTTTDLYRRGLIEPHGSANRGPAASNAGVGLFCATGVDIGAGVLPGVDPSPIATNRTRAWSGSAFVITAVKPGVPSAARMYIGPSV